MFHSDNLEECTDCWKNTSAVGLLPPKKSAGQSLATKNRMYKSSKSNKVQVSGRFNCLGREKRDLRVFASDSAGEPPFSKSSIKVITLGYNGTTI